ncbi:NUMOD4 motif [Yersinia enterocolitica]|nr:NUMOD4 motif [Yersinia enterocolitica]
MTKEWRDVVGYEDHYKVSSQGEILGPRGLVLKGGINSRGYNYVILSKNNIQVNRVVHRLVAKAFLDNPKDKVDVNHLNGIKTDNRIENLEWATRSENIKHAYATGLARATPSLLGRFGANHPKYKGPVVATSVLDGSKIVMRGVKEIRDNNFDQGNVANCLRGKAKTHKGYTFERIEGV